MDANIFLNVIFEERTFVKASSELLRKVEEKKFESVFVSTVTLAEVVWVVFQDLGYKKASEALSYLRDLSQLNVLKTIPLSEDLIPIMLELINKYKLSLLDSLIATTALKTGSALITRDDDFRKIGEIKVILPEKLL
ncbi:MAG: type II toxin-antitoxin system VapC family toxin [Euryarchaeota archaeon]|nr:type II toxin-antitoxin system VapC family toxin [Euryarchaeota archaeon]